MRMLLNTLYVTNPEAYVSRDGENVVIKINNKEALRRPIHILEGIVCFNYVGISPGLMKLCVDNNVAVSFLNEYGSFLARVSGRTKGNVILRRTQYRYADNIEKSLEISKNCIIGKIVNCRNVVKRAMRDHKDVVDNDKMKVSLEKLSISLESAKDAVNIDELRGIEGEAARNYFSIFDNFILKQKDDFYFKERNKRPPKDNLNALLSFAYTLLANDMGSALETVGLDPYVGFMHTDRPGRISLALDMIEELRAYIAERFVISLINKKQISSNGFIKKESGGIIMDKEAKSIFLTAWQKRKQETITHPFLNEKVEIGLIPYVQAMLLARYLRRDIDSYPPFFMR
ncbi:type I-C CRISPR-associated endonuclease Cas1c [Clostridium felsineum]|uniref:CRISPR-associated endonuclease Cas1 n=1 Tax=Clostridium felsineum TaxID=36839 RepID=A0A1S8KY74_9CLOT|nr:type I-C CRISPR-associated endonuclease Cas1c [Clostridium felsineum]URZ05945.1 CRISPR-associated endonuclease Cas1 [Clostridium felsineum]URZ10982.1 CRISPR-associated endonuclease Cas1 [Clostridium felsineum]